MDLATLYTTWAYRSTLRSPDIGRWESIRNTYNGDLIVPLPELSDRELPSVPNLLCQAIDQMSMRIASTLPDVQYPALRPGIKVSEDRASSRRKANLAWWTANNMVRQLPRRARYHTAYGTTAVQIEPDFDRGLPKYRIRNPLTAYPPPMSDPDNIVPPNMIFATVRSQTELKRSFPTLVDAFSYWTPVADRVFTLLEYIDGDTIMSAVMGPSMTDLCYTQFNQSGCEAIILEPAQMSGGAGTMNPKTATNPGKAIVKVNQMPNRAGIPLVINPGRITLDRASGMFDSLVGMYLQRARMMALESIAAEQAIFPDMWAEERPGEQLTIVNQADGRRGIVGKISGGAIVPINPQPGTAATQVIDRLERAERQNGAIPQEWAGESPTNVRTARRGDSVMSATVDFHIKEAQDTFALSLDYENRAAIAVELAYFGSQKKSFAVNWKNAPKGLFDYVPSDIFRENGQTVDVSATSYSHAGADAQTLTVMLGQLQGLGVLSKLSLARMHPDIDDAEYEHDQLTREQLETAVLASVQQGATTGQLSVDDVSFIAQQVGQNKMDLFAAVEAAQKRAQSRQASNGAPGTPEAPADPGSPEAQPGLAAGSPAEPGAASPTIGPPGQAIGNLSDLVTTLSRANRQQRGVPAVAPTPSAALPA